MTLPAKGSVLIVDDEESVLITVQGVLSQAGFDAVATTTCSEALDRLRQQSFDVVLSDVRLEDGDGLTIVEEARRRSPATSAILLTGYGSLESAIGALRRGVSDYLQKPCSIEELQRSVARAIEQHQTLRVVEQRQAELAAANAGLVAMNADFLRRINTLVDEAHTRSRMLRTVAEAGRVLAGPVEDPAELLHEAARLVVPSLADACAVYALGCDQRLGLLAFAYVNQEREREFRELQACQPVELQEDGEVATVLRTGEPILLDGIDESFLAARSRWCSNPSTDLVLALRPQSVLFVPLVSHGSVLGVLVLASHTSARRLGLDELACAEHLAARAAQFLPDG
jgi:ActR/RegA family two-component response regulator